MQVRHFFAGTGNACVSGLTSTLVRGKRIMMKKCLSAFAALLLGLSFSFGTQAKTLELSATGTMYETHPVIAGTLLPWFEMRTEATGNKVTFEYFSPGTICPVNEIYPSVAAGVVDLGISSLTMTPGRYPLWSVMELPLIFSSNSQFSVVSQLLYEKYPELQKELKGLHPIALFGSVPMQLVSKKPVKTFADIKGLKVGATTQGNIAPLAAFGASPVQIASTDMYMALQRGMVDAVIWPIPSIMSFKFHEVAKYVTMLDLTAASSYFFINEDSWNNLPKDVQDVFLPTMGMRGTLSYSTCSDNSAIRDTETLKNAGVTFITLPDEEKAKFVAAVKPLSENWLADMEKKGFANIRAIYADMLSIAAEYTPEKINALRQEVKPYNTK